MTTPRKLIDLIVNNKKIEAAETFNWLMAQRAVDRLAEFKKDVAQSLYSKRGK